MKIEQELRTLEVIDNKFLEQYIVFCKENNLGSRNRGVALHHILPAKVFPEYDDLRLNKWNGSYLTYENHYIAHALLALAINNPSIIGAWWGMNNKTENVIGIEVIGPKKYSELFEKAQVAQSKRMKGKVQCRLKTDPNKSLIVDKEEFYENRHLYLGNTEGKLSVIDKETGMKVYIDKEEYDRELHYFHKTGIKRNKESIQKGINTKRGIINEDGLNLLQIGGIKAAESIKNRLSKEEYEKLSLRKAHHKEKHPLALKINIYDKDGAAQYSCNGNIKDIIEENNLPKSLIKSYRNETIIGNAPHAKSRMLNNGQGKYIGWYARIIK